MRAGATLRDLRAILGTFAEPDARRPLRPDAHAGSAGPPNHRYHHVATSIPVTASKDTPAAVQIFELEPSRARRPASIHGRVAIMATVAAIFIVLSIVLLRFDAHDPIGVIAALLSLTVFGGGLLAAAAVVTVGLINRRRDRPALRLRLDDRGIEWTTAAAASPIFLRWSNVARFVTIGSDRDDAASKTMGVVPVDAEAAMAGLPRGISAIFSSHFARYGALPIGSLRSATVEDTVTQLEAARAARLAAR